LSAENFIVPAHNRHYVLFDWRLIFHPIRESHQPVAAALVDLTRPYSSGFLLSVVPNPHWTLAVPWAIEEVYVSYAGGLLVVTKYRIYEPRDNTPDWHH
jgi:hypothetical protein